jgi:hypothetical protein
MSDVLPSTNVIIRVCHEPGSTLVETAVRRDTLGLVEPRTSSLSRRW